MSDEVFYAKYEPEDWQLADGYPQEIAAGTKVSIEWRSGEWFAVPAENIYRVLGVVDQDRLAVISIGRPVTEFVSELTVNRK